MDSYLVRVYRQGLPGSREVVGTVQAVAGDSEAQQPFASLEELCTTLRREIRRRSAPAMAKDEAAER